MNYSQLQQTHTQIQGITIDGLLDAVKKIVENSMEQYLQKVANVNIPSGDKKLLTSNELANWLGVSKVSLWRYERAGLLHPVRLGKNKLYDLDEVRELFAIKGKEV